MLRFAFSPARDRRAGFTLVELLVVMVIIGILVAILMPAVQSARDAARNTQSRNNLRQIQLAMIQHEVNRGHLPPSNQFHSAISGNPDIAGWSIHALILPYLEQGLISSQIDYRLPYSAIGNVTLANGESVKLSALRVPTYVSPAEPRDEVRIEGGVPMHYPFNYAVNLGPFFVYDPATRRGGLGAAYPNSKLQSTRFTDGTTNTLGWAEVKAWQPYYRNTARTHAELATIPTAATICSYANDFKLTGHTEWCDGRSHHSGFTTAFLPNEKVQCTESGVDYEVDWNNWQEGKGLNAATPTYTPTYAAVTARSYFTGAVNVSLMDGSVRPVSDNINLGVWRAVSTREGREFLPDDFHKQ
jgi:prepilin-type N-terminal cleavage/methylation domain-containing protein